MNICFLCTSSIDYPGPRARWLPLAQELVRRGYMIRFLLLHHTYDRLARNQRRQERAGVVIDHVGQMHVYGPIGKRRYFGPLKLIQISLMGALALMRAALTAKPDALHVCKAQPINGLAGLLAARYLGIPMYVDCDDYEAGSNRFGAAWQQHLVRFWENRLPQLADGVTTNSRFMQQHCRSLDIPDQRIVYVPNGVTQEQLLPPDRRLVEGLRAGLGLVGHPTVAYVGTLSQNTHNVGLLLEAFAIIVQQRPDARLLLVGDGEDRHMLQQLAEQLAIANQTLWTGAVPPEDVPTYLALAMCLVDPVDDTPVAQARTPLKIVESLAIGVPIVTGDIAGRRETLGTQAGVLVAPNSPSALACGILKIVDYPEQRNLLVCGARQRAEAHRWSYLASDWEQVYQLPIGSKSVAI